MPDPSYNVNVMPMPKAANPFAVVAEEMHKQFPTAAGEDAEAIGWVQHLAESYKGSPTADRVIVLALGEAALVYEARESLRAGLKHIDEQLAAAEAT